MEVLTLTKENFDQIVSEKKTLVDFWASWCGPCRMMSPVIDAIAAERTDLCVGKVNVDEESDLAQRFGVMSIPTVMLFENGARVAQNVGYAPKEKILEMIGK